MGFDLFMAVAVIVAAAIATWGILRLLLDGTGDGDRSGSADVAATDTTHTGGDAIAVNFEEGEKSGHITDGTSHSNAAADDAEATIVERAENRYVGKRLALAVLLTVPASIAAALPFSHAAAPGWLINPWLHAIIITPVMFYCAAPIHRRGLAALRRRTPNADSLMSLSMWIVYACNLLLCVVSSIFSQNLHAPYFAFVGIVTILSFAIALIRRHMAAGTAIASGEAGKSADEEKGAEERFLRATIKRVVHTHVLRATGAVTMVVAVWTFALWMAFGLQPKLSIAVLISATVLAVAGLALQACDRTSADSQEPLQP